MYPENVALSFTSEILWPQSEFDGSGTRPGAGFVGCMHTQSLYLMLHHYLTSNKKIDCCATDSDLSLLFGPFSPDKEVQNMEKGQKEHPDYS